MVTSKHAQEIGGLFGSSVAWLLAFTGWSMQDVQAFVAIGSGLAAMSVSLLTIYFMFRNRGVGKGGG